MSSPCYDDVIPECYMQLCPYKGPTYLNQVDKQVAGSRLQNSRPQDKSVVEPSRSRALGTRQEATIEAKDQLIIEVNEVNVGTEATAFIFTAQLLEGEPEL